MSRFRFNTIRLFTTENARMVAFYCDVFGFRTEWNVTESWGQRTCYVSDPEGNLIEISSFNE